MSPSFWRNSRKGIRQLSGKVAVVTGAASGIGRGLALGLWEKGCHLALVDLDPGGLTRLHAELGRSGGDQTATTHVADVGERARMRDLAGELVRETAARATDPVKADIDPTPPRDYSTPCGGDSGEPGAGARRSRIGARRRL